MTSSQPKRGKRIQVYLAADLIERWEQTPRYERSAEVARALRKHWGIGVKNTDVNTGAAEEHDKQHDTPR